MGLSHMTARLQTTCQDGSLHIDQPQAAYRQRLHLSAKRPYLIIESALAPHRAPRGSSAHEMAMETMVFQQADLL